MQLANAAYPLLFSTLLSLTAAADPAAQATAAAEARQACDAGDLGQCTTYAMHVAKGEGVAQDLQWAMAEWTRLCKAEWIPNACENAALGHERGAGVAVDPIRVRTFRQRALMIYSSRCKGNASACEQADRVRRELHEGSHSALQSRCDEDHLDACSRLGAELLHLADPDAQHRGYPLLEQACRGGARSACGNVALARIQGRGVAADPAAGLAQAKALCGEGDTWSCELSEAAGVGLLPRLCGDSARACSPQNWK